MGLLGLLLAGLLIAHGNGLSEPCPCSASNGRLTCAENTIFQFPEDLNVESCGVDVSAVWAVEIDRQPIQSLKNHAFQQFPMLFQLSMSFNNISKIEKDAFSGLSLLSGLFLKENNISQIEDGAFDPLIELKILDLRGNLFLASYTTESWQFCNIADKFELFETGPAVYKSLERSRQTEDYCSNQNTYPFENCNKVGDYLDCTTVEDFDDAPCYINDKNFTNILYKFPKDIYESPVADFYEGESNKFFQEFNSQQGSMEHAGYMRELTLYETKFDLRKLQSYTSSRTKLVTIKADTVYMSAPISISHKLVIQARVVSLAHPITMNMTRNMFFNEDGVESWAEKEEFYTVGNVLMNRKQYGLVTILKNEIELPVPDKGSVCQPKVISVEESGIDIHDWFDTTLTNLNYVCARTILDTQRNAPLVNDISTFMLGFVYNDTIVKNRETFIAVQKYKRILELNQQGKVNNVPSYSVDTISSLANIMYDRMTLYKLNELSQEEQLFIASGRVQDMKVQFEMIEQQQELYFEMEMAILDSIWAAADNNWDFDFQHRNGIEDQIGGSLDAIAEQMLDMQQKDLELALAAAEDSVAHIEAVIDKYETQVARLLQFTKASIDVQTELVRRLKHNSYNMNGEFLRFERAIEDWKHKQEVKAAWGIFKAVVTFGMGLATGELDPTAIGDAIGAIMDIEALILEMIEMIENCNDIQDMINEIDFSGIADINLNLNTNFKDALQSAIDMKLKGSDFDEIERTATIKLDAMNHATNYEISGTDDVMMACVSVSDVGHQLITEAADFADTVLQLAERNDELAVARQDKNRTVAEVEHIKQLLADLEQQREEFEENREKAREEYEQQLRDMEAQYHNITDALREEYRQNITAAFLNYQVTFHELAEGYNEKIYLLIEGVHQKFYGLKEHSMNQRAMIMTLFVDYSDADFYHTFKPYDKQNMPFMSDELDVLLEKLIFIQWDSVTANENIPGTPIEFSGDFIIEDNGNPIGETKRFIVESFRNNSEVDINLRDLDTTNHFDDFWRVRIERLTMVLLDEEDFPIQSNGTTFGREIQIGIHYPTIFNDTDFNGDNQSFLALNFDCNSDYVTHGSDIVWKSNCQVDEEFSQKNYKPAPDGIFSFKIKNPDAIEMDRLSKVLIGFSGTRINFGVQEV